MRALSISATYAVVSGEEAVYNASLRSDLTQLYSKQLPALSAKEKAADMLDQASSNVEEIERESYKDREIWSAAEFRGTIGQVPCPMIDAKQAIQIVVKLATGDSFPYP